MTEKSILPTDSRTWNYFTSTLIFIYCGMISNVKGEYFNVKQYINRKYFGYA